MKLRFMIAVFFALQSVWGSSLDGPCVYEREYFKQSTLWVNYDLLDSSKKKEFRKILEQPDCPIKDLTLIGKDIPIKPFSKNTSLKRLRIVAVISPWDLGNLCRRLRERQNLKTNLSFFLTQGTDLLGHLLDEDVQATRFNKLDVTLSCVPNRAVEALAKLKSIKLVLHAQDGYARFVLAPLAETLRKKEAQFKSVHICGTSLRVKEDYQAAKCFCEMARLREIKHDFYASNALSWVGLPSDALTPEMNMTIDTIAPVAFIGMVLSLVYGSFGGAL